ncbi:hypothetical protein GVX82_03270, partial [Patescibacteria group bacterium]|nr:hypothetical protein [Patescibacteria group bacterium]
WGGHIGLDVFDHDSDGADEAFLVFDDDPPSGPVDSGQVSNSGLLGIDALVDDGDLATGRFRAPYPGVSTGAGSGAFLLTQD